MSAMHTDFSLSSTRCSC